MKEIKSQEHLDNMARKGTQRQPKPVLVTLEGEPEDVRYWRMELQHRAEFKGDMAMPMGINAFKIYPRAVNE